MAAIVLKGEANIYEISSLLEMILNKWKKDSALRLDLAKVKDVDASFVQLLLSCKRSAQEHAQAFELINVPEELQLIMDGLYASDYINSHAADGFEMIEAEQKQEEM